MSYGTPEWLDWVLPEEEGIAHIKAAYDGGINAFDTANVYSNGLSEVILGNAIKKYNLPRDEIVVMTKVFFTVDRAPETIIAPKTSENYSYVNQKGLSRKHIFDSVAASLKRLQLDYIDVLQCHRFDTETPIEETINASTPRRCSGWLCTLHRHVLMLGLAIPRNAKLCDPKPPDALHLHAEPLQPRLSRGGAGNDTDLEALRRRLYPMVSTGARSVGSS